MEYKCLKSQKQGNMLLYNNSLFYYANSTMTDQFVNAGDSTVVTQ